MALQLLAHPGLADLRIVLLDPLAEPLANRWWGYWSTHQVAPGAESGQWKQLRLRSADRDVQVRLGAWRYRRLDGPALGRQVAAAIAASASRRVEVAATGVDQSEREAVVHLADGGSLRTRWVLDSAWSVPEQQGPWLSFLGWRVWPGSPALDTATVGLMDFDVPQRDALRFGYYLPETPEHGVFELCSFHQDGPDQDLAADLPGWVSAQLSGGAYRHEVVENAGYPLRSHGLRQSGPTLLRIGFNAGLVRPTTGYGLIAYARDAAAVADSLASRANPFSTFRPRRRERALDAVALEVLRADPAALRSAYLAMFDANPAGRVLRFLDGTATSRDIARLVATLPAGPFLRAAFRSLPGHRVGPA